MYSSIVFITFQMTSNFYTNQANKLGDRQVHLRNGTLFDAYQYMVSVENTGRWKMFVRNKFDGFITIHHCSHCTDLYPAPSSILRIAHYKCYLWFHNYTYNSYMSQYTPALKKMVSQAT